VLLVSYYFDQDNEIGSVRPKALARHLPEHGWTVIVITAGDPATDVDAESLVVRHVPAPSTVRDAKRRFGVDVSSDRAVWGVGASRLDAIRRVPRRLLREAAGIVPDTALWPWRARRAALAAARADRPEAIFSSAPPHTVSLLAWALAGRLRVPWVAELRDLWVGYPERRGTTIRRAIDRVLEAIVMRRPRALVTVSGPLADTLRRLHPKTEVRSIVTGVDPTLVAPAGTSLDSAFTILYAGRIYAGRQDLRLVLRALRRAIDDGSVAADATRLDLLLLHPLPEEDAAAIETLGLGNVVHVIPTMPRADVIERERRSQLLLHLRWDDRRQPGILTGKVFEYLAARRPILSTGRYRDAVSDLLRETAAGVAPNGEAELATAFGSAFAEFRATGAVAFHGNPDALARIDAAGMAREVAGLLERVTELSPHNR
jgi:glycosyltransferase involved in cell wall biosynthesis